ncbi:hypothetical protein LY76DRAFT_587339 [Colletotrichum caudatum]|nr:hypothetical protein LY76DRAFT_587339 [Colletotrichum caudatum]
MFSVGRPSTLSIPLVLLNLVGPTRKSHAHVLRYYKSCLSRHSQHFLSVADALPGNFTLCPAALVHACGRHPQQRQSMVED